MKYNTILNADSYKMSHWYMYPEGTTNVYSYMESRGGKYSDIVFFGLQGFIKEYLMKPIKRSDIKYAKEFAEQHGVPFNEDGWKHILNKHGGYLPVEIKAIPEGLVTNPKNVLMTVENTDPEVPFITSYIETSGLRLWYPITVASRGLYIKKQIKPYFEMTSDTENTDFALLDFSARGCTSYESNIIGGAAHLLNFSGSDSMSAIDYIKQNYGGTVEGYSVPATEHSIMCSYGQENEINSFERLIDVSKPNSILSVVSDTWNIYDACEKWVKLKDKIFEKNINLVVRPDSGDIKEVMRKIIVTLAEGFGTKKNNKGYDVINNVKILWGDGINEDTATMPFHIAAMSNISSDSIMTGSGGGLMQANMDRDTCKFAFKASNIKINGNDIDIAKNPITDKGKQSKKGKLSLIKGINGYETINKTENGNDILRTVYKNGELLIDENFQTIKNRVKI